MQIIVIPFSNIIKIKKRGIYFFLLAVYLYFLSQTSMISMLSVCVRMPQITAASPLFDVFVSALHALYAIVWRADTPSVCALVCHNKPRGTEETDTALLPWRRPIWREAK